MSSIHGLSPGNMRATKGPCEQCVHCAGWLADCVAGVWRYDLRVWCVHRAPKPGKGYVNVEPARGCVYWTRAPDPDDYPYTP